jgi:hypothetical protein
MEGSRRIELPEIGLSSYAVGRGLRPSTMPRSRPRERRVESMRATPLIAFVALLLLLFSQRGMAQHEATAANPAAPSEVNQYAFMLGDWTGRRLDNGTTIRWHGTYILDGWAVRTDWENRYANGTVQRGTMIRTFDPQRDQWRIAETYSLHPRLDVFTGRSYGDSLIQSAIPAGQEDRRRARRVYFNIRPAAFEDRVEVSFDGGQNWTLQFRETFVRDGSTTGSLPAAHRVKNAAIDVPE